MASNAASCSLAQKLRRAASCVAHSLFSLVAASSSEADPPYRPLHSKLTAATAAVALCSANVQQLVYDYKGQSAACNTSDDDEDQLPAEQIPEGFLPVLVGPDYRTCYVIRAGVLSHPLLGQVLQMSAQEFGYAHHGALKLPCDAPHFEELLHRIQYSCMSITSTYRCGACHDVRLLTPPLVYSISNL